MTPFQERVVAEKTELDIKLAKLDAFISGPVFPTIGVEDQFLLEEQDYAMNCYSTVLARRIARFG